MYDQLDTLLNKSVLLQEEIEYLCNYGINSYKNKKYETSKVLLDLCIKNNYSLAIHELIKIYYFEEDYDNVILTYSKGVKMKDEMSIFELGKIYFEGEITNKDLFLAGELFKKIKDKNILKKILGYGEEKLYNYDYETAEITFTTLLEKNIDNEHMYNLLTHLFLSTKKENKYKALLLHGIKNNSEFCLKQQIDFLFKNEFFDECIKICDYCCYLGYSFGYYKLGCIYIAKKNYKSAIKYFDSAINMNNTDSYIKLADLYYNGIYFKKNVEKAIELLEKAIEKGNTFAINNMIKLIYCESKNTDKIKEYILKGCELDDTQSLYNMAFLYKKDGDVDNYIMHLSEVARRRFHDAEENLINFKVKKDIYNKKISEILSLKKEIKELRKKIDFFKSK